MHAEISNTETRGEQECVSSSAGGEKTRKDRETGTEARPPMFASIVTSENFQHRTGLPAQSDSGFFFFFFFFGLIFITGRVLFQSINK